MTKDRRGIQSVELASALLAELAKRPLGSTIKELAAGVGMTPGKAYPYLVTFLKVGFVVQTQSGHYDLGPFALQLGLAKLHRMDPVREASELIDELVRATGLSVSVAVWGSHGPTIVRYDDPLEPIHVNIRAGTVMSLKSTATGRLFAAYMPPKVIERVLTQESTSPSDGSYARAGTVEQLEPQLAEIRKHGVSRTLGRPIPGINALCSPVFDGTGNLALAVTVMGPADTWDPGWSGPVAKLLRECTQNISKRIGSEDEKANGKKT